MVAESVAFDNVKELTRMAKDLETFVQAAAADGSSAHMVEKGIWQRVLAMGRQAMGSFFEMQGDGNVGDLVELSDGSELR